MLQGSPERAEKCKDELDHLHSAPQTAATMMESKSLENKILALSRKEEVFWLQQSMVSWMRKGDRNSKFFHRVAGGRRKRNTIK